MPRLRPRSHLDTISVSHLCKDMKQNTSSRDTQIPGAWNPGWNSDFAFQVHLESAMQQLSLSMPEQYVAGVKRIGQYRVSCSAYCQCNCWTQMLILQKQHDLVRHRNTSLCDRSEKITHGGINKLFTIDAYFMHCSALIRCTSYPYLVMWAHVEPHEHQQAHHWSNQFIKKWWQRACIHSIIAQFTTQWWAFSPLTVQKSHFEIGKIMLHFSCL